MSSTALSATNKTESGIMFKSNAHEKFYYEKLKKMQYKDEYHMALCYCLGISDDRSRCISQGTLLLPWNKRGYTKKCG